MSKLLEADAQKIRPSGHLSTRFLYSMLRCHAQKSFDPEVHGCIAQGRRCTMQFVAHTV